MEFNVFLLAKYPFLEEAKSFLESYSTVSFENLSSDEDYTRAVKRGVERIKEAILFKKISFKNENLIDFKAEILSFPIAVAFIAALNDDFLRNIYATAEGKRIHELLKRDSYSDLELLLRDQKINFYPSEDSPSSLYKIAFSEYLKVSPQKWGKIWKLVNRQIKLGFVYVTREELSRLVSEHIKNRILERSRHPIDAESFSGPLKKGYIELKNVWDSYKSRFAKFEKETSEVSFPPCMVRLLSRQENGENLSHVERRSLVTYLIAKGQSIEEIINLLKSSPDFKESIARYQVEHLAGLKGSKKKYSPPSCETMKSYGLCFSDEWCKGIKHPLQYKGKPFSQTSKN
ncbi:MAG: DNA primase large subunit PriL [Thermoproteota archaeon]|nr:DNA primase large subunit PriL [Candidatus Brockarchaeota archaeon]MBO3768356.1 DNA primase large subunit PriL [Candidatus Brockarchaeota archaeon]MBO3800802.1 DNA primase large subunit PriL [Candidatus Brockarchaeota archaeon]